MQFDPLDVILMYVALLFSLTVHEAAHAAMANWRGDPSARLMGRLTLNPVAHIDPVGTVLLPLIMLTLNTGVLFGWAKPVPFNPANLKDIRRDPVWIALAGPGANLSLLALSVVAMRILVTAAQLQWAGSSVGIFINFLFLLAATNAVLMLFNLIPVPPLDGHHLLYYFLPPSGQRVLEQIGPFGIIIAIVFARFFLGGPFVAILRLVERLSGLSALYGL